MWPQKWNSDEPRAHPGGEQEAAIEPYFQNLPQPAGSPLHHLRGLSCDSAAQITLKRQCRNTLQDIWTSKRGVSGAAKAYNRGKSTNLVAHRRHVLPPYLSSVWLADEEA